MPEAGGPFVQINTVSEKYQLQAKIAEFELWWILPQWVKNNTI